MKNNYQSIPKSDCVVSNGNNGTHTSNGRSIAASVINNTHPEDHLAPPFESSSEDRPSNLFVGTFNLIATVVGGGVLSLPIVFEKCGVAFTTLAMILSAYMTYMSLMMLCYCSRRGGGSSYGEVVRSAFGEKMEEGVSWLLFVFLMFVITGYMVLIKDIWTPLVQQLATGASSHAEKVVSENVVLAGIIVVLLPLLFQRSLHALRWNCYVGSASIFVLCIALCRGGWQRIHESTLLSSAIQDDAAQEIESSEDVISSTNLNTNSIEIFKVPSTKDVLFCFPIVTCAFLCHFNIIAIQNALSKPTRQRIQNLTAYAILACFALMYLFGLGGYLYAGQFTQGNILLNVPMERQVNEDSEEYYLFLLGRIGCGTTIMLAMPLMALPCREALLEVVDVWFHHSHHVEDVAAADHATTALTLAVENGNDDSNQLDGSHRSTNSEEAPIWKLFHQYNSTETMQDATITTEDEVTEIHPASSPASRVLIRHDPIQQDYIFRNTLAHYGSTILIVVSCYLGAVAVSGVAVVWSFIGSSMAFFIAFILPCGCFIVIERNVASVEDGGDRKEGWIHVAWAILVFSVVGAMVCTANNTFGLGR